MRLAFIAVVALLAGCEQFTAGEAILLDRGGAAADEALATAEAYICRVATVGSIQRRYMRSADDWEVWNAMCRTDQTMPLPE